MTQEMTPVEHVIVRMWRLASQDSAHEAAAFAEAGERLMGAFELAYTQGDMEGAQMLMLAALLARVRARMAILEDLSAQLKAQQMHALDVQDHIEALH